MLTNRYSLSSSAVLAVLAAIVLVALSAMPAAAASPAVAPVQPPAAAAAAVVTLTAEEQAGLVYMREEEKLAHDVYVALYAQWGVAAFRNIANAELRHTSAVVGLLERYGIADPAATLAAGEFSIPELQELYATLVAQGQESLEAALNVGASIEELDIKDLDERLSAVVAADVNRVYTHLRNGSASHLRAFARLIERETGSAWEPQLLTSAEYAAIAGGTPGNSGTARGNRGRHRP